MKRSFYARYAWPILIVAVGLLPVLVWGMNESFERANNNVYQWLPQDFPETETYERFRRLFGADDFALISWDDCTLEDERLEKLARELVPPPEKRGEGDGTECFEKVLTGAGALRTLMEPPFELPREEALKRLEGTLVGRDLHSTCAVVTLSRIGDTDRCKALDSLVEIAVTRCGLKRDELHLGGDTVLNAAIDIESERALNTWVGLAVALAVVVAWLCLRCLKLMLMVFFVSMYAAIAGTATIFFTGGQMNLVLVIVPVLIFVLTLSASVHLANYYRDALRTTGLVGAPVEAIAMGWTPCALSAVTTALGLGSLYVSHIIPVKMFGFYSAVGVLLGLGVLFVLLPVMMETWPLAEEAKRIVSRPAGRTTRRERLLHGFANFVVVRRGIVAFVCMLILLVCACGVLFIETSVRPVKFFDPQSVWISDYRWLEHRIGPMASIEVVLGVDDRSGLSTVEQLLVVDDVERAIGNLECIGATISAAAFAPSLDDVRSGAGSAGEGGQTGRAMLKVFGVRDPVVLRRKILNKRLDRHRNVFVENRYLNENSHEDLWRITARAKGSGELDYERVMNDVRHCVDGFLKQYGSLQQHITPVYTGSAPLVFVAQQELFDGLFKSFCLAFGLIFIVMVVLLRNVLAGMVAMLPNVFPAVVIFGTMGWRSTAVDVGAMMTASVALGIAVDDTLHFLTWFRRALDRGRTRRLAIIEAYGRCAPAMTQTTLIAGLSMLAFALSAFQPVSQFGLLMFILLVAALVGDLIFLPALLATWAGESFVRWSRTANHLDRRPLDTAERFTGSPGQRWLP